MYEKSTPKGALNYSVFILTFIVILIKICYTQYVAKQIGGNMQGGTSMSKKTINFNFNKKIIENC